MERSKLSDALDFLDEAKDLTAFLQEALCGKRELGLSENATFGLRITFSALNKYFDLIRECMRKPPS
jgi:hypothetical protein